MRKRQGIPTFLSFLLTLVPFCPEQVSGECPEWDEVVKTLTTKETIEFKPQMNQDALKLVFEYYSKARYQGNGGKQLRPILKVAFFKVSGPTTNLINLFLERGNEYESRQ